MIVVRPARPGDFSEAEEIHWATLNDRNRTAWVRRAAAEGQCLLAEREGEVVGLLILTHDFFGCGFIALLIVHPDHRGGGVAGRLIQAAEGACRTEKLFTSTNQSNVAMQRLCTKLGFVPSGVVENIDEGDPELIFFKRVKG